MSVGVFSILISPLSFSQPGIKALFSYTSIIYSCLWFIKWSTAWPKIRWSQRLTWVKGRGHWKLHRIWNRGWGILMWRQERWRYLHTCILKVLNTVILWCCLLEVGVTIHLNILIHILILVCISQEHIRWYGHIFLLSVVLWIRRLTLFVHIIILHWWTK